MIDEKKLIKEICNMFAETYTNVSEFNEEETKLAERIMSDVKKLVEEQEKIGEWIPCEVSLPKNYQEVLASMDGFVKQAQFIDKVFMCEDPEFYGMLDDSKMIGCEDTTFRVIAWQPLPEHYKGENSNEN